MAGWSVDGHEIRFDVTHRRRIMSFATISVKIAELFIVFVLFFIEKDTFSIEK